MIVLSKTTNLPFLVFESFGIELINSEVKCLKQGLPQFSMYLIHVKKLFKQRMLTSLVLTWGGSAVGGICKSSKYSTFLILPFSGL